MKSPLGGGDVAHIALVARERAYRQVIAALYWRAGVALIAEQAAHAKWSVAQDRGERARHARVADNYGHVQDALETAAQAMEAACAR